MRHIPKDPPLLNAGTLIILSLTVAVWVLQLNKPGLGLELALHHVRDQDFRVYQILTYSFAHGSWLHLVVNLITLLSFGQALELIMDKGRLMGVYLGCSLGAALFFLLIPLNQAPVLGASGAVMGMMVIMMYLFPKRKVRFFFVLVLPIWLLVPLVATALVLMDPKGVGTAHMAHLGGAIAGLVLGVVIDRWRKKNLDE